jgi:hypothetical protein
VKTEPRGEEIATTFLGNVQVTILDGWCRDLSFDDTMDYEWDHAVDHEPKCKISI